MYGVSTKPPNVGRESTKKKVHLLSDHVPHKKKATFVFKYVISTPEKKKKRQRQRRRGKEAHYHVKFQEFLLSDWKDGNCLAPRCLRCDDAGAVERCMRVTIRGAPA